MAEVYRVFWDVLRHIGHVRSAQQSAVPQPAAQRWARAMQFTINAPTSRSATRGPPPSRPSTKISCRPRPEKKTAARPRRMQKRRLHARGRGPLGRCFGTVRRGVSYGRRVRSLGAPRAAGASFVGVRPVLRGRAGRGTKHSGRPRLGAGARDAGTSMLNFGEVEGAAEAFRRALRCARATLSLERSSTRSSMLERRLQG